MKHKLKIIPVPDPRLIPRYLLEQVKDRKWEPDEWYAYQLKLGGLDGNLVLTLIDKEHLIKGFVWLTINGFEKNIHINVVSVDREYQQKSKLIKFIGSYIKDLAKKLKIEDVTWVSTRSKAYQRYGFEESKLKLIQAKA